MLSYRSLSRLGPGRGGRRDMSTGDPAPLRIGVLGAARISGQALLQPALDIAGVEVVAIAARDRSRARAQADAFGVARVHDSYSALLTDPDVDAVYIPLPINLHHEWTLAAIESASVAGTPAAEVTGQLPQVHDFTIEFDDPVAYTRQFGSKIPDAKPSMFQDFLAGRPCEIDAINGMVPVLGHELGIACPFNTTLSALVRRREEPFA